MKNLLSLSLSLCFLTTVISTAQQNVSNVWANQANTVFNGLDKNRVPYSILLDYAMEFTEVPVYNGTLTSDNFIDVNVFSDIYKTLFFGKTNTDETYLPLLKTVATSWLTKRQAANTQETTTLVLLGLSYTYSKLSENALANNRITVTNNRYYDKYINGVWQNPYEVTQALAITPPINTIKERTFNILFPRALFYSNHDSTILSIQINVNDGQGYKNLPFDQPIAVNYQSNGDYNWIFKVTYNTGGSTVSRYTKTKVRIAQEFTVTQWEDRYKAQY